jgi:hypothetical protein
MIQLLGWQWQCMLKIGPEDKFTSKSLINVFEHFLQFHFFHTFGLLCTEKGVITE